MKIHRTITGEGITITVRATRLGEPITASLSGHERFQYALIDGLLWWTLCRKLEAFTLGMANVPGLGAFQELEENGTPARLLRYVFTTQFHAQGQEESTRTMRTILKHLPELEELAMGNAERESEHRQMVRLAEILQARIARPGDAEHAVGEYLVNTTPAAA